ncbi:glycoside hydrolase family 3 C-terminal domain-containing protein [Scatolibacter rhodanostii]|uniref:glycoside hydrolase family 3 C-terminal domain-containing protein n=1 Tax=Scatolibacter rhodanostii TaxID=2014781 RepID=UPI001FA84657|nr:glycoside hydrolase family 3 C-terminal domain-containing protein [Scatolibacter rhodanostii]
MNIKNLLSKMSLEEKIALCSGADFWHTKTMEQHGIPSMMVCDGPHGLRKQENETDMLGINLSVPATSFPTAVSTGCSWNTELLEEIGEAIGQEAVANKIGVVLGPGANIKRNPLCGRNFEYFSEDPLLTGKLAAGLIRGIESTGIGSSLKHFAFNNQEYKRFSSDSIMDERTMREIYLTGFEIAVKEGKPSTVMSAYNKINGEHCSDSKMLLTDILRNEWGFDGMVLTDWGGMSNRIKGFKSGCDLCMPGGSAYMEKEALAAVKDGSLSEQDIDCSAERILDKIFAAQKAFVQKISVNMDAHHTLARKAAEESAVLLKNDDDLLPLSTDSKIVFIGEMAKEIRYQGAGSSHINPWKLTNVTDSCPDIPYSNDPEAARNAEIAVVFAGLTPAYESEGFDRDNMKMPEMHLELIEKVASINPNTVVVLLCGSAVEMPWDDKVKSILYMGLPGQAGGEAIANLLFGKVSPSGKLAESWPIHYQDCVCSTYFGKKDAHYREGLYVGYRYYSTAKINVRYPFGHGLSYTSFVYSNLSLSNGTVTVDVRNTGKQAAKEVVQLYVLPPKDGLYRPAKELKSFTKVFLLPGECKTVSLPIHERSFAVWQDNWVVPSGVYTISVGGSSENLPLSITTEKRGEKIKDNRPEWYYHPSSAPSQQDYEKLIEKSVVAPSLIKGHFTMDNTVMEMKDYSLIMKIMYKAVEATIAKGFAGKKDYSNPEFRMLMNSAADSSLSGMKISGGMKNYVLEGMLAMANGHFFKGLGLMMKKA